MGNFLKKYKILEILILVAASYLIFAPIYYSELYLSAKNDFPAHLAWARQIYSTPQLVPGFVIAHAGWEWAVFFTRQFFDVPWSNAALSVTLTSVLETVVILYFFLRKNLSALLAGALSIGLLLIGPLAAFYPIDHLWYIGGYVWPNIYHNPTFLLLRPFAILQFYFAYEAMRGKKAAWPEIVLAALISLAAAFAKPNYIICLLPALGIIALIRLLRKEAVDWKQLILGIGIPSVAILIWQYLLAFYTNSQSQIVISPFSVMALYSQNLLLKFLLSIVFPLIVTILYWKDAIRDPRIQLGWLSFVFGAICTYFIADAGILYPQGTFIFSGEITLFILFVCCIFFLAERKLPEKSTVSRFLVLTTGFLHLLSGIFYYFFRFYIP